MTNYTKMYEYGPYKFKCYFKPVGYGYEVGMMWKDKTIFVGNFIHKKEAMTWWKYYNSQCKTFFKKYSFPFNTPKAFYTEFMTNYFYNLYYNWLETAFKKYSTSYEKAYTKDLKYYREMKKTTGTQYYGQTKAA